VVSLDYHHSKLDPRKISENVGWTNWRRNQLHGLLSGLGTSSQDLRNSKVTPIGRSLETSKFRLKQQ